MLYGGADRDKLNICSRKDLLKDETGSDMLKAEADIGRFFGDTAADLVFASTDFEWLSSGAAGNKASAGGQNDERDDGVGVDHLYGAAGNDQLFGVGAEAASDEGIASQFELSELNNGDSNVIDAKGRFEQKILDGVEKVEVAGAASNFLGDDGLFTTIDMLEHVVKIDGGGEGRGNAARADKANGEGSHAGRDNPSFGDQLRAHAESQQEGAGQDTATDGAGELITGSAFLDGGDLLM